MQSKASTVEEYLNELPEDRIAAMLQLQKTIKKNLPKGFSEEMNYGMLGYVVPHKLYPAGYHCDPKLPLPFLAIAIYHMGIYADPKLHDWFINAYAELNIGKLDMGKSCIRFKNPAKIPFDLIGQLVSKMSPQQWIAMYESNYKK